MLRVGCISFQSEGMVMDWRQMAGRPTVIGMPIGEKWWAWSGGRKVGYGVDNGQWDGSQDPIRGWIIAFCWIVACSAEYVSTFDCTALLY